MTPEEFLRKIERTGHEGTYLFLGPDAYRRGRCRSALLEKVLLPDERESGYTRRDLDEASLREVIEDAQSLSLFATRRVIWVSSAEQALPRGRAAADPDDDDTKGRTGNGLAEYAADPVPGTVVVFDCSRYELEGDDKAKVDRVRKFYAAVRQTVEFARLDAREANAFVQTEAASRGLQIAPPEIDLLVEATGADAGRIANELEKLALFRGKGGTVTADDIAALVANGRETTVFAFVNALGRGDRTQSLELLDTLVRDGEYLPLALTFLATLFRLALAAKERRLRSSYDIQNYFQSQGLPMWRSRADQVWSVSSRFSEQKLREAITLVFEADRGMKSARPDDRLVMEGFLLKLTG
jgi:DNA polymerase III subunit delta